MKSALFVDFDNVFSLLRQLHPHCAEQFARHPDVWMHWLIHSLQLPEPHDGAQRRRLLVRRCYLNPNWYQGFRHAFLRAGFEIVDCPPVTSQGKTSTDIHLVLDAVELLQHETHYDEFIVFSADADFTPLLRKLRRHDRRTTVLAIGFPSAAYQASADLLIPERVFVSEALQGQTDRTRDGSVASVEADPKSAERAESDGLAAAVPVPAPVAQPAADVPRLARPASDDELSEIANRIWQAVDESATPVPSGLLAARLKADYPQALENWNGCGAFRPFFVSLKMARLLWVSGSGGRIIDPAVHEVEGKPANEEPDSPWRDEADLFAPVKEVCAMTRAPMLSPKDLRTVLEALSTALVQAPHQPATLAARVCSRCLEAAGLRVRQRDVAFLIKGLQLNGHVFGAGQDDVHTLGCRLVNQILFLCAREQMALDESAELAIRRWVTGNVAATQEAAGDRANGRLG